MEIFAVIVVAVVVGVCANMYMKKKNAECTDVSYEASASQTNLVSKSEGKNMEDKVMEEKKGTRDLFLETLTKIGCQYEVAEGEEGDINFAYQGEYFVVQASNNWRFIRIYDTHWGHVELYDVDEFTRLKKAINEANLRHSVTTVYTIDEAGSNVDVHCKSVILFIPEIPVIEDYLRLELNDYFRVHETINLEMAKLREAESK